MITGLLGRQDSGKTLMLSLKAHEYYKKGFKVFSNYHLKFPYEYVSFEDVENDIKNEESKYKGGIFCVDEIGTWLDSRTSMSKKSRVVSYFITQVRKRNLVFAYTTQFSD